MWTFSITWHPSFVVCHLLTFHILIFSFETHQPNELKLSRKHLWKVRKKNCLWWPCLLMDRNLISNLYRGHSIDASYQVSIHLAKRFQRRRFFRNQPIRNKNCLWMNRNLVGSTYGRFCIKFPQSRMKGERHRASSLIYEVSYNEMQASILLQ
jgi:hypothetical protein